MTRFAIVLMAALVVGAVSPAGAQVDSALAAAQGGAPVRLRLRDGTRLAGHVVATRPDTIDLDSPLGPRRIALGEVIEARQRQPDGLRNGTLIGAVVGGGTILGLTAAIWPMLECKGCGGRVAAITAVYAGIGAGIGALVDAAIQRDVLLYRHPTLRVSAHVTPGSGSARVTMRF